MKSKKSGLILTYFLLVSCYSQAADIKEIDKKALYACYSIYKIAASAIANKEKGLSKKDLLKPLPNRDQLESYPENKLGEKLLGLSMLDIADQIYSFEISASKPYLTYSAEVCQRKLRGLETPSNFSDIYPIIKACEQKPADQQIPCGMAAAGSLQ